MRVAADTCPPTVQEDPGGTASTQLIKSTGSDSFRASRNYTSADESSKTSGGLDCVVFRMTHVVDLSSEHHRLHRT